MDLGIEGKWALVLGASKGIGASIARALGEERCNVIIGARNSDGIRKLASEIRTEHGVEVIPHAIDLTDAKAVADLCHKIENDWEVDILLNNTGGPPPSGSRGVSDDVWSESVQGLLMTVIRLTEAAVKGMVARRWGRILTVASSGVIQPIPNLAVSNTVRSAAAGFSKSLAGEVAKDGITVNMILPGRINTGRLTQINTQNAERQGITLEAFEEASLATIPAGRFGTPEEFAKVAVFLMSDHAGYVTGSMVRVDGGIIKGI